MNREFEEMKNPRKNEPALSDMLLKLRFAEKKHVFWVFSARSADFSRMSGGWPSLHGGFSRKIPLRLPSPTAC
jgi:hypothetical protein